jgi:hypothetical protein
LSPFAPGAHVHEVPLSPPPVEPAALPASSMLCAFAFEPPVKLAPPHAMKAIVSSVMKKYLLRLLREFMFVVSLLLFLSPNAPETCDARGFC